MENPRGQGGKFISEEKAQNLGTDDLPDLISSSTKVTGALKDLQEIKNDEDINKPLVKVEVNNPVAWFQKWLKELKKRQTTTVTIRFGVPLIAIPVIATAVGAVLFGLGRASKTSVEPTPTPSVVATQAPAVKSIKIGKIQKTGDSFYLFVTNNEVYKISFDPQINLGQYDTKKVVVTGYYNQTSSSLLINSADDIQIIASKNITKTPIPTQVPSQN